MSATALWHGDAREDSVAAMIDARLGARVTLADMGEPSLTGRARPSELVNLTWSGSVVDGGDQVVVLGMAWLGAEMGR